WTSTVIVAAAEEVLKPPVMAMVLPGARVMEALLRRVPPAGVMEKVPPPRAEREPLLVLRVARALKELAPPMVTVVLLVVTRRPAGKSRRAVPRAIQVPPE